MSGLWLREPGSYKGYSVRSPPGLQEAAMKVLLRQGVPRPSVLDLASGGAMLARLSEVGSGDLHAVGRDPSLVGETDTAVPEEWNVASLDLNRSFSAEIGRRFGVVVSSEVIEHLDSPRAFLGEVHRLLEENGYLLLTTPNVANWTGRIWFVLFGELRWFDERMYRQARHISPITDLQMRAMLTETGFDLVAATSAGSFSGPLRALLTAPLSLPFLARFGRRGWGDCNIYLARWRRR